jgi:ATP synthase protein I
MNERDEDGSLDDLSSRLKAAQAKRSESARDTSTRKRGGDFGPAVRVGVDLVSGIVVGVLIGLGLDKWLGTGPWLMLVFFILGSAAGITNVMRSARRMEADARAHRDEQTPADDK